MVHPIGFGLPAQAAHIGVTQGKNERRCKLIVRKNAVSSVTVLAATNTTSVIGAITTANHSLWVIDK